MLYRFDVDAEPSAALEPVSFSSLTALEKLEKDLEQVLAANLFGVLFEDARLLPVFQERSRQREADVYAVDGDGDLHLFELKRGTGGRSAVTQLLDYGETAGQWKYERLDRMYREYEGKAVEGESLRSAHRAAYGLSTELEPLSFNRRQHFHVVGHAADEDLVEAVEYWKTQGLDIDFVPYRIYELDGQLYFEFFSLPYDQHRNPANVKGVLFDTNASYDEGSIWEMMEKGRVAAYGGAKRFVDFVRPRDFVFFYHKGKGIVAAGRVVGGRHVVKHEDYDEWYRDVEFLTPVPTRDQGVQRAMSPGQIREATDKSFFWARTIKVPYLDTDESGALLDSLMQILK